MNRLEPILRQKFWILLGVALIMTVTGWWLTTSDMSVKIKARETDIENAFKMIPKGKIPNDNWVNQLRDINTTQERSINQTRAALWQRQLAKLSEWPEGVKPKGGYPDGKFSHEAKEEYKDIYVEEVTKVWKKLHPMDVDGSGLVYYPLGNMFAILRRQPEWRDLIPDKEMWDIKEDLCLLESLFESIAAVNGGIDQLRTVDMIHEIDVLELHGGGSNKPKGTAPYAPPFATTVAPLPIIPPDFNVAEEWGDDGSVTAARTFAPQAQVAAAPSGGGPFGRMIDDDSTTPMPNTAAAPQKPVTRYIQNEPTQPYRTRGFYLSVKMDHQKIPQLIAELTANNRTVWPIEITRVHMSRLHEDSGSGGPLGSPGARPQASATVGVDDSSSGDNDTSESLFLAALNRARSAAANPPSAPTAVQTPQDAVSTVTELTRSAKASLEKALAHPNIAQVTLCGVFTLYQPVQEPAAAPTAPPAAAPAAVATPDNLAAPETTDNAKAEAEAGTADDTKPTADAGTDPGAESTAPPADPASEASADSTPEPAPDPNSDPAPNNDPGDQPKPDAVKKEEPQ